MIPPDGSWYFVTSKEREGGREGGRMKSDVPRRRGHY